MPEKSTVPASVLSRKKQLAFALLLFERMLPSLLAFSKDTGFDDSCYLRAKDAAWLALQSDTVDRALNQACIRSAPDTEEFSHELTSYALNAALAMSDILEFVMGGSMDLIEHVSALARDSIHVYLSGLNPSVAPLSEENRRIAMHPLMQQEQRQEEEDRKFLSNLPDTFDRNAISVLRVRAKAQSSLLPPMLLS